MKSPDSILTTKNRISQMKNKTQIFDIPFIGYDYGSKHQWDFDVLIGKYGNPVIGIKIKI